MTYIIIFSIITAITWIAVSSIQKKTTKIHIKYVLDLIKILMTCYLIGAIISHVSGDPAMGGSVLKNGTIIVAIVTFAAQKGLNNVISGFTISVFKPFQIGQKIKVLSASGTTIAEGYVTDITMRHTIITRYDERTEIVPNGVIDESIIINTDYIQGAGNYIEFQIRYSDDVDKTIDIIKDICGKDPLITRITEPLVSGFAADGPIIKVAIFTDSIDENFTACSNVRRSLLKRLPEAGIEIPYQTITIQD